MNAPSVVAAAALSTLPALSGTVYGALLNHRPQWAALGAAMEAPPYKGAPRAPVLSAMPRHMLAGDGSALVLPSGEAGLEVGVAVGLVIGRPACRVPEAQALDCIAGVVVVGEVNLPLDSHYRPALRRRARDGFCPLGRRVVPLGALPPLHALLLRVHVDGAVVQEARNDDRVRDAARLLADVSAFMTLQPGDVLSMGRAHGAPLVRAGQRVVLEIEGVGRLHHVVVAGEHAA